MEIALGLVGAFIVALCYAVTRVTPNLRTSNHYRAQKRVSETYIDPFPYVPLMIFCSMALIVFMILGAQIAFDFGCPC